MLFVCKYGAVFTTAFILFSSANASSFSLWDVARPVPTNKFSTGVNVFTFTTPGVGSCIGVDYQFYSDAACTGFLSTMTYPAVIVDSAHANKTFYIDASGLYSIASLLDTTSAQCAKEADEYNPSNVTSTPISCSSMTSQCISPSTQALPETLRDNPLACA